MTAPHSPENPAQRSRIEPIAARLADEDLAQPLGEGWTPAVVLAHLAFWNRRAALLLDRWQRGQIPPPDEPDWYGADVLNDALLPEWQALPPRESVRLVLEAAQTIDREVETLDASVVDEVIAKDEEWLLARWRHRREHLDYIERALA
jgi:hypothetical protein